MYAITISKIPGNKWGDCYYTFTEGDVVENKTWGSYPSFVIKVGVENIAWDFSDKRQATMKARVEKLIADKLAKSAGSAKKETVKKPEPAKCEEVEAEVKVTSNGEPLKEVKGMGNIEAVSGTRIFTNDDGDTITVIA